MKDQKDKAGRPPAVSFEALHRMVVEQLLAVQAAEVAERGDYRGAGEQILDDEHLRVTSSH